MRVEDTHDKGQEKMEWDVSIPIIIDMSIFLTELESSL